MNHSRSMLIWAAALVAAGVGALVSVFPVRRGGAGPAPRPPDEIRVAWRVPVSARDDAPCPLPDGWALAEASGGVTKVTAAGRVLWRAAFSNETFAGAAGAEGGRVFAASQSGRVFCLDGATGAVVWQRETEGRFQHAPQAGRRGAEAVVWLVSQEDGRLFCLRASDGAVVWTTEATNRCDGDPVVFGDRIAYGNCDGAVYVFSAMDGSAQGSVAVGDDDQMAGGVLALGDSRLVTGTRQGNLAVVNPLSRVCEAKVKVSESEAFVTPVALPGGLVAMGSDEGAVTLWRRPEGGGPLSPAGRFEAGAPVKSLAASGGRLFALAGGTLFVIDSSGLPVQRLALGDDAGRLAVNAAGDLACVVDGALVCMKGGVR